MVKRTITKADEILDIAQELIQLRGYNGFSYADLSARIGIRKASIHHHFPTKDALGASLAKRYRQAFMMELDAIEKSTHDPRKKLLNYIALFESTLEAGGKICMCGMLAADWKTLPSTMKPEVASFFTDNETWLSNVLKEGRALKVFRDDIPIALQAQGFLATLEGAMLMSRTHGDSRRFSTIARGMVTALQARE